MRCLLIQTKPSATCGIYLMFVCFPFIFTLLVCLFVFVFFVQVFDFYVSIWHSLSIICLCRGSSTLFFQVFLLHSFSPGSGLVIPAFLPVSAPCTFLTLDGAVECMFAPATL